LTELASRVLEGTKKALSMASSLVEEALNKLGREASVSFPETNYSLPAIYGLLGTRVENVDELVRVLSTLNEGVKKELTTEGMLSNGMITLMAFELAEGARYALEKEPYRDPYVGFVTDALFRRVSLGLADGTIPGIVVVRGEAEDEHSAAQLGREIRSRSLLGLLSGRIIDQMQKAGVTFGLDQNLLPLGDEPSSLIHAVNLAVRASLMFGSIEPGMKNELTRYLKERVPAFVVSLGKLDDLTLAVGIGAIALGLPVVTDQVVTEIPGALLSRPGYRVLVSSGCTLKKIRTRVVVKPPIPVDYGPAYEGKSVRKEEMYVEFGGGRSVAFELVRKRRPEEIVDGAVNVQGLDLADMSEGKAQAFGMIVDVAGAKFEKDFEPVFERRLHQFLNRAEGIMHLASRDIVWIRISKEAFKKGFRISNLGDIVVTMFRATFPALVDKVQVTILTDEKKVQKSILEARRFYEERDRRMKELTEDNVHVFYGCSLCQSFAPVHACVITPERISLCGATTWMDAKVSHSIDPQGPNFEVPKGKCLDPVKGEWEGVNRKVYERSHNTVERVFLHSMFGYPHTSCGCFEAIVFYIPEVNGMGIVDRESKGPTVNGMSFSAMAGLAGGGRQTEGFLGIGVNYMRSRKFLQADGGWKKIVWLPRKMKEAMKEAIPPELYDKIATEENAKSLEDLKRFLKEAKSILD